MGCRSDYLEPNAQEAYSKEVAGHIVWLCGKFGHPAEPWIQAAAANVYGNAARHDELTATLCGLIRESDQKVVERIIYNARDAEARKVATWWEDHQRVDAEREQAEAEKQRRTNIATKLRDNLTAEEREIVRWAVMNNII